MKAWRFLLDRLRQLCTVQYDENQLDERNQPPKRQTEQRLDLHAVLKLPDPEVVLYSVQSQDYSKQVGFALNSSHAKE
jgi:hypothetical protein